MSTQQVILAARHVHKGFVMGGQKIEVLKGLDLQLLAGETLAILGPSGSGKSTLLGLLAGLETPDSGEIALRGEVLSELDQAALTRYRARYLGIVFQQFHLMRHLSALENVMLPLEIAGQSGRTVRQRAVELLEQVRLGHRLDHYPHQLSGGECQRVAIARALSPEPELILADEPSGNLDQETGEQVMGALFEMVRAQGRSLILVTHNPEQAMRCDRQLHLQHGQLV
ncbi:MAG: ABC transporter ATP-binding protein [Candidatus Sericytochromatia bacterium]|nr:ABC transporter ATP-binding protein [Candidatus Sericytochromatia bacterium]